MARTKKKTDDGKPSMQVIRGGADVEEEQNSKASQDAGEAGTELPTEPPEAIPNDLADVPVDEAVRSKDLDVLSEVISDIDRIETQVESEQKAKAAEFAKRLKTIKARRHDVLEQIRELTHTWEIDHSAGVARMVSVRTGQVKITRGLHPSEKQVVIPFAEG